MLFILVFFVDFVKDFRPDGPQSLASVFVSRLARNGKP